MAATTVAVRARGLRAFVLVSVMLALLVALPAAPSPGAEDGAVAAQSGATWTLYVANWNDETVSPGDFGDGSAPVTTISPTVTHAYAGPGSYTVMVTETSSGGTSTSKAFTGQTMRRNGGPSAVARVTVPITIAPNFTGEPRGSPGGARQCDV